MVELNAYVSGDVAVITQLLSQVAIVMTSDDFETGVKLFALVGILLGLFGALMKGGKLTSEIFVLPVFVIAFGIIPKADLVIEDESGGLSKVDDLPIIAAAPISLVTTIGRSLNQLLTDNLGLGDRAMSMENGHILQVRAPIAVRDILIDPEMNDGFASLPGGIDVNSDIPLYVAKCVGYEQRKSSGPPPSLFHDDVNTAFAASNAALTVATSSGQSFACGTYFENIMEGIESGAFETGLKEALDNQFSRYRNEVSIGERYLTALDDLVASRTDFYKTVLFGAAIEKARAYYTRAGGGGSSYVALQDAMDQRRWKNYGAAAMVFETLQHMTTFIEGWTLCIMPLIALLFVAGANGIKLGVKYFWLLVWTQLWYPTVLITVGILDAYAKGAATSTYSVSQMTHFLDEMYRLQDVGYLFLSLTTMMSIFLIYGSSAYLAGSLQSDMTGAQHYDPKKNAPDTVSRAPQVQYESAFGHTNAGGYKGNVGGLHTVQFSLDTQRSAGVSEAQINSFAATGSRGAGSEVSVGSQARTGMSDATTRDSRQGQENRLAQESGAEIREGLGQEERLASGSTSDNRTSASTEANVRGSLMGAAAGLVGAIAGESSRAAKGAEGAAKASPVDIGGRSTVDVSSSSGQSDSAARQMEAETGLSETRRVQASESETQATANTQSERIDSSVDDSTQTRDSATESRQETSTDSQSSSMTEEIRTGSGGRVNIGGIEAANAIARDRGLMTSMVRDANEAGISHQVDNYMLKNADQLDRAFMGENAEDARYAFSSMMVMQGMGGSPYAGQENAAERMDALNAIGDEYLHAVTFGEASPQYGDARDEDAAAATAHDLSDRIDAIHMQSTMTEADVRDTLTSIDPALSPGETFAELERRVAPRLDALTDGQASGLLATSRDWIMSRYGEETEEARPFAQKLREEGVQGLVRGALGRDPHDVDMHNTADVLRHSLAEADKTGEAEAGAVLKARMEDFQASGIHADDPVARYMAATQLQVGAAAAAEGLRAGISDIVPIGTGSEELRELEDGFSDIRAGLIATTPALSNETVEGAGEREGSPDIAGLAMVAADSDHAFARAYPAAQMMGNLAELEHRYEAETGGQASTHPDDVDWSGPGAIRGGLSGEFGDVLPISEYDRDIAIRTVIGEAASEDDVGQAAVAQVLRNRFEEGYGDSVAGVALADKQFSAWNAGAGGNHLTDKYGPGDAPYERVGAIVDSVFDGSAEDPTHGATHYYSPAGMEHLVAEGHQSNLTPHWFSEMENETGSTTIGGHIFTGGRHRG